MARRGQRQGATRTQPRNQRRGRDLDNDGIIPVLARAVREVEAAAERGRVQPSGRTKFQVIALLVREERTRVKADDTLTEAQRAAQLKRLDGVATILAKTAARDTSLLQLLDEEAQVSDGAKALKREMLLAGGLEPPVEEEPEVDDDAAPAPVNERRVVPQSVRARQLANPFLTPDFSNATSNSSGARLLASWELLGPLFRAFEEASGGVSSCMELPEPTSLQGPARPRADAAPGAGGRRRGRRPPHLPARRRARPGQDRPGAAGRAGGQGLPAARRRAQRRQDQLGPRGRPLDARTTRPP